MSKRARRLWLGDWQRDQAAEPLQEDTVTILPDEEEDAAEPRNDQRRNRQRVVAAAAAATVLAALALTLLNGGDDKSSRTTAQQTPPAQTFQAQPQVPQQVPQVPPGAGGGFGGPDLTGPAATKAAEAALSKFPGDIERVTAGPGGAGGYVVHVIQGDGNEVHVVVSDEFKVLGSDAGRGGPGYGGGGGISPPSGSGNSS